MFFLPDERHFRTQILKVTQTHSLLASYAHFRWGIRVTCFDCWRGTHTSCLLLRCLWRGGGGQGPTPPGSPRGGAATPPPPPHPGGCGCKKSPWWPRLTNAGLRAGPDLLLTFLQLFPDVTSFRISSFCPPQHFPSGEREDVHVDNILTQV